MLCSSLIRNHSQLFSCSCHICNSIVVIEPHGCLRVLGKHVLICCSEHFTEQQVKHGKAHLVTSQFAS